MHDDRELAETRIRRTVGSRLRPNLYAARAPLEVSAWHVPGEPVPAEVARAQTYEPFRVGQPWGRPWGTTWFRLQGSVPPEWTGRTVELVVDFFNSAGPGFQSEGALYRFDGGGPIRGIHPRHQAVPVELVADADGSLDVLVEAAANPEIGTSHAPTPWGDLATAGEAPLYRLNRAELALRNDAVYHLDLDVQIVSGLMRTMSTEDPRRFELLRALDAVADTFDPHDPEATAAAARDHLVPVLSRPAAEHAHRTSAIGHAHIDSAWLWPLRETRRKCARTFGSAVTLMDAYPEYRFACSQAAQYDWIEQDHPDLFARIADKVAAGQFVPVGSMWVEADANLPSGESLARQFVWGKRYFAERFGIETTEVWIPDVFGYSANLPQIMALAGCDAFLTQKLSWNQVNSFPHNSFWWEGIDGTRIFTHFPPADTYNGEVTPDELDRGVRQFRDKGRATRSMYLFGHGDGGGGPTREMLERARRVADLDGLPHLAIETPAAFFAHARDEYPDAAVWRGELYFEMHRGTYTSQARTKRGNRQGELALREAELWTARAGVTPRDDLERLWKVLLLHQFHDIIPGSSIAWVHDDTEAAHAELSAEVEAIVGGALDRVADGHTAAVAANASPFDFRGVLLGPLGAVWAEAPAHGIGPVTDAAPPAVAPVTVDASGDGFVLDNGLVRVAIAADGTLFSVEDHVAERECLAGPGNVLQLFRDLPNTYDAWDIEAHTLAMAPTELREAEAVEVVGADPLLASVRVRRSFSASTIEQTYVLRAGSGRLDIVTAVDWHENEMLLKAAFPLDVRADDAAFDVQYGHVRRPTHRNTSWDVARFEVCGHFWADVAEPDFGVAVLNDGKYGHDVVGSSRSTTMRLSLLRAPNYPDPDADRGRHEFTYSLLPHRAGLAEVVAESWALNLPPRVTTGRPVGSLVAVDHPGVVVTAVKEADDGSGDLVVRLHEMFGGRARTSLRVDGRRSTVVDVDLLERPSGSARSFDGSTDLELRPFQIRTLRFG